VSPSTSVTVAAAFVSSSFYRAAHHGKISSLPHITQRNQSEHTVSTQHEKNGAEEKLLQYLTQGLHYILVLKFKDFRGRSAWSLQHGQYYSNI